MKIKLSKLGVNRIGSILETAGRYKHPVYLIIPEAGGAKTLLQGFVEGLDYKDMTFEVRGSMRDEVDSID